MDQVSGLWIPSKSILFTPCDKIKLVEKAAVSNAGTVCLDLEDGVALGSKQFARQQLDLAARILGEADKPFYVRVNSEPELFEDDLQALPNNCEAVILPKTLGFEHIRLTGEALDSIAENGGTNPRIICQIESSTGLIAINQVGGFVHPRLCALSLGTEDFAAEIGCSPNSALIRTAFHQVVISACALGIPAIGVLASISDFKNLDRFRTGANLARDCGVIGGFCIHPNQVGILNETFEPSEDELIKAAKIIAAFECAEKSGDGVTVVDGKMIDKPVYLNAKKTKLRQC